MSKPLKVTSQDFEEKVLKSSTPTVVDFWAAWCGPCRMLAPVVDTLADEYDGQIQFAKLDVDANPDVSQAYGVHGIPTLILFAGGQEVDRFVGYIPKDRLAHGLDLSLAKIAPVAG
ncbi:MAG TPA: thioredoxin [Anaerolineae bacterium]|nr:thioredoxin [Anaerolineae bacterium]